MHEYTIVYSFILLWMGILHVFQDFAFLHSFAMNMLMCMSCVCICVSFSLCSPRSQISEYGIGIIWFVEIMPNIFSHLSIKDFMDIFPFQHLILPDWIFTALVDIKWFSFLLVLWFPHLVKRLWLFSPLSSVLSVLFFWILSHLSIFLILLLDVCFPEVFSSFVANSFNFLWGGFFFFDEQNV